MTTVFDVANYIISRRGPMSAMKLQKLCYYAQAWSLTWTERELFPEEIEAWANGPVVRSLYAAHRGEYRVEREFAAGRIGNPMGFRGVWLTPGAAVNRRLRSGMCRD